MNLYALLCWYDESPNWLSATVASLAQIGVTHLIASDGAYLHFPNGRARSGHEQTEAIRMSCDAINIGCTIHHPDTVWYGGQVEKRNQMFRLAEAIGAETFVDWFFVIDADEQITRGTPDVKTELEATTYDSASIHLWQREDPYATIDTERISTQFDSPRTFSGQTRRFYRCLENMKCEHAHSVFTGTTPDGERVSLRAAEHAGKVGLTASTEVILEHAVWVEHRNPRRDMRRVKEKSQFYNDRSAMGIETFPTTIKA